MKIAFISSFTPRKCGIAAFTWDLIESVKLAAEDEFDPMVVAMESDTEHEYHRPVELKVRKEVEDDYIEAADYLNRSDADVISLQHEYGLFGGKAGAYLNNLLGKVDKPVITTLHTVLQNPTTGYFNSLTNVCETSEKIIVMNSRGIKMLQEIYFVPEKKIELIPHGIPDLPFVDSLWYKRKLGIADRKVVLTFGLLSKNKGIEVMLQAMPSIVKADPSVLYIVLGATHPEVLYREGQSYKMTLENIVKDLGLQSHVYFLNRFVDNDELSQFLAAADIYVTPYLHKEQLTSGTLAFAVGAGKVTVSTPYWAAQDLLARGRGKLVPFGDAVKMGEAIVELLDNKGALNDMKRRAYEYSRSMIWPNVGQAYWELLRSRIPSISA